MSNPERVRDCDLTADPNDIVFRRHTYIANIDVIIACGKIRTRAESKCDVEIIGAARQTLHADSCVQLARCVAI
jgi:hypothetical protein